jgi:hypothetical protein
VEVEEWNSEALAVVVAVVAAAAGFAAAGY